MSGIRRDRKVTTASDSIEDQKAKARLPRVIGLLSVVGIIASLYSMYTTIDLFMEVQQVYNPMMRAGWMAGTQLEGTFLAAAEQAYKQFLLLVFITVVLGVGHIIGYLGLLRRFTWAWKLTLGLFILDFVRFGFTVNLVGLLGATTGLLILYWKKSWFKEYGRSLG